MWVQFEGLKDVDLLLQIAEHFGIHPLALEDVVNVPQRPKQELADRYVLAITRAVREASSEGPVTEQVSLVLGERFVLSFQESYATRFEPIRDRLQRPDARLRKLGSDYLAYALLDAVIDGYFPMLEKFGEDLERLEASVLAAPQPDHLQRITDIKRQLIGLRRTTWAQREMVGELLRLDGTLASDQVKTFTRDLYDHCIQIADVVDMYRETATGLVNTYLSSVGQRTNDIMKTLTIVGSIFIPLTFLAGIYGMNFEYMPELQSRWAYPIFWLGHGADYQHDGLLLLSLRLDRGQSFDEQVNNAIRQTHGKVSAVQTDDWDQAVRPPAGDRKAA